MAFVDIALYDLMRNTCKYTLVQWVSRVHEDQEHTERGNRVPA
jgi:hypothetical protein